MTRKLIFGLLLLMMAALVSACGVAGTRPTDTSLHDKDQDQSTVIIGGYTKFSVSRQVN